ncbi:hypothetical protein [Salinicola halophyticus]|uniref:hypothetical protein n=1 Tax=Salinicola halophyticus TaxID=1808881 RepID=UPI000DA119E8|nr:hypothetical protein [Salinicola halophyticus]
MKTLGCCLIVGWMMSGGTGWGIAWASETGAESTTGCANFRCEFGDVPKAHSPLINEPFVSFYRDSVVKPMRPYRDWEPTARQMPGSRQPRDDTSGEAGHRSSARD